VYLASPHFARHDPGVRAVFFAIALAACDGASAPIATHVDDWRDQVLYQIVVDRFDNGDPENDAADGIEPEPGDLARMQGGDWQGVIDRLDYLERLGVTALWLSPPYLNVPRTEREDGYHGYWPADFITASERFGGLDLLRELVRRAHERGMLVILDVVPNHAGRVFNYDLDGDGVVDEGEIEPPWSDPPYEAPLLFDHSPRMFAGGEPFELTPEHFHRRGYGDLGVPMQKELGDFPTGLRDLDTENPDVIEALIETHVWWVEQTDVDGYRVDAVPHAGRTFWATFCQGLRDRLHELGKDRFFLVGEVFDGNPEVLASYTELHALDAAFAFDLKRTLINGVILEGAPPSVARGALSTDRALFASSGQPNGIDLSPWEARVSFGDNHDVYRLRGELDDPLAAEIALVVVLTVDAIPAIYYGTEQALDGRAHHLAREPLWEHGFDEDHPMFRFLSRLIAIRRASPALRYGSLEVRYLSSSGGADEEPADDAGMIAYERAYEGQRMLIVINSALEESTATFSTGFRAGARLYDALGGTDDPWIVDRTITVRLPGRAAVVLEER
jgi:alpha-amylase